MQICFDPEIPLLGIYPTDILAQVQNNVLTRLLIAALFVIVKDWKQTTSLSIRRAFKINHHICNDILTMTQYAALRKERALHIDIERYLRYMKFKKKGR